MTGGRRAKSTAHWRTQQGHKGQSKVKYTCQKHFKGKKSKVQVSSTDIESSSDEEIPCLSVLKSSKAVQKRVNERLAEIEHSSKLEGNEHCKIKSKRGGGADVAVAKKVAWSQDSILSGPTKQRVTYDQLSLVQFVQGFTRNIIDESHEKIRERMLWYWRTQPTLHGAVQRPHTQCSSVKWRGAR